MARRHPVITILTYSFSAPFALILVLIPFGIVFSPVIVLVWTLIHFGERGHEVALQCLDRGKDHGFVGNPDFYGLGIRLGMYMQWIGSLIANVALPSERRSMAGAYAGFSVALLAALLLLIFQRECAFTAEVIIILYILFGGVYLVLLPYMTAASRDWDWTDLKGLETAPFWLLLPLLPIAAWFWLRLATVGEVDFAPTPNGTSFFLFAHVPTSQLRIASRFMSFFYLWMLGTPLSGFVLVPWMKMFKEDSVFKYIPILLTAYGFFTAVIYAFSFAFGYLFGNVMLLVNRSGGNVLPWLERKLEGSEVDEWAIAAVGLIIFIWSIAAVELTLKWNAVQEVYNVKSTGQIIPLVVGLAILINISWKLIHKNEDTPSNGNSADDVEMQGAHENGGLWYHFNRMMALGNDHSQINCAEARTFP